MSSKEGKKKVVVVGGGISGALLAKSLQFHADVVLIDPKEYFEITYANLRAKVEPSFAERSVVKHSDYFTNGRIVVSYAVGVTETGVLTSDGHLIPYDYLVIATGNNDSYPKTRSMRLEQYEEDYEKIKSANSVLIVGGGSTGVELAGEIAVDFPEKKVTLVHKNSRLLDFMGVKASRKTLDWLTSKNVEVILGQTVDLNSHSDGAKTYQTSKGETITADCHFFCAGVPLGSSWIKESVLKDALDAGGRLMVDEHLRIKGRKNVFAIGDITDIPEIKQGFFAMQHAMVTAKNLKLLIYGGKESKMATYKAGPDMAIVSLGRKDAVVQYPMTTMIGRIPGFMKSSDQFVGKTRKQMGIDTSCFPL
ncbi:FAD-dependent pyridine nucleotide-disulfide oxidoreductase [Macleaya cordata]|uniref:FAD-dependent pyridine nucleotide-disulfide oxidoreductase n=1 Tax=Macleaya cordata TaxID=56857 RepID=A0A200Q9M1_MACCD|nr:FAD-dependent pyridine nucleotide-disulfide oxidoreductase [Macleaya cordata]